MSSEEFLWESYENKSGKNEGTRGIKFHGSRINKTTGNKEVFCKENFEKYLCKDFSKFH